MNQLATISPALYNEMDCLRDKRGRVTDIYVKLIPAEKASTPLIGATFFAKAGTDEDAHNSEYGEHSVSIKILCVSNALQLLYHELGHVNYVVPNLSEYVKFYRLCYADRHLSPHQTGHHSRDLSGKEAKAFESRYHNDYSHYLQFGGPRLDSVPTLMQRIKGNQSLVTVNFSNAGLSYDQ